MALHFPLAVRPTVAPSGWFAAAVPTTLIAVGLTMTVAAWTGLLVVGLVAGIGLVVVPGAVASRHTRESAAAYLGGAAATLVGLYVAVGVAAELWLHSLGF